MTQQYRDALRRNGSWLADHGLVKLGVWFYNIAQADWEMELAAIDKHRKRQHHMSDETQPFWAQPQNTETYTRPQKPTWRARAEHHISAVRDWYDALRDYMPAIAATTTFIYLLTHTPHR